MAPRTPRIATGFDKRDTCTNPDCESEDLDRDTDLDDRIWTCKECGDPVLVEMTDDAGHKCHVRRYQAQHLEPDDFIYQEQDLARCVRVKDSAEGTVKGNKWYLALEYIGNRHVEPDRYYNCVPSS